jgi:hypothetical protein
MQADTAACMALIILMCSACCPLQSVILRHRKNILAKNISRKGYNSNGRSIPHICAEGYTRIGCYASRHNILQREKETEPIC